MPCYIFYWGNSCQKTSYVLEYKYIYAYKHLKKCCLSIMTWDLFAPRWFKSESYLWRWTFRGCQCW